VLVIGDRRVNSGSRTRRPDREGPGAEETFLRLSVRGARAQVLVVLTSVPEPDDSLRLTPRKAWRVRETAAAYRARPPNAVRLSPGQVAHDPAIDQVVLTRSAELVARGRHAAAERRLRSAWQACSRRGRAEAAATLAATLARLLVDRGRAQDAVAVLLAAQEITSGETAGRLAVALAHARIETGALTEAEAAARAALAVARDIGARAVERDHALALARTLYWQGRYPEAADTLQSCRDTEPTSRHCRWVARVAVARLRLPEAGQAISAALGQGDRHDAGERSAVHLAAARLSAAIGDAGAFGSHVGDALAAVRGARRPLSVLRCRLVEAEGWARLGRPEHARRSARHLDRWNRRGLSPLLQARVAHARAVLGDREAARVARQWAARWRTCCTCVTPPRTSGPRLPG